MEKKWLLGMIILVILINVSFVSAALTSGQEETITNFLENPFVRILVGNPADSFDAFGEGLPLGRSGAIIIHVVFWLMLFFAFSDIIGAFAPFQNKYVPWILGGGLTIIAANFGVIPWILALMATFTAYFGAFSVIASLIIAFASFLLVAFFGNKLKVMQAKKLASEAEAGAYEAAAGVTVAKRLAKAARGA